MCASACEHLVTMELWNIHNSVQRISGRIKKSDKVVQDRKILIFAFEKFLHFQKEVISPARNLRTRQVSDPLWIRDLSSHPHFSSPTPTPTTAPRETYLGSCQTSMMVRFAKK